MKNPFPGMNPYLEEHWRDVHRAARDLPAFVAQAFAGRPHPLRPGDADVALDLQPLMDQSFKRGRYWMLDYHRDPRPPLAQEDSGWLDELLRQSGLR